MMYYQEHISYQQRFNENGGCLKLLASAFLAFIFFLAVGVMLSGCRSVKGSTKSNSEVSLVSSIQSNSASSENKTVITETETVMCVEESSKTRTHTIITTLSAPDSLGNQYPEKVEESITETETERTDGIVESGKGKTETNQRKEENSSTQNELNANETDETEIQKKCVPLWVYPISAVLLAGMFIFVLKKIGII